MPQTKNKLERARQRKDDEFYTQYESVIEYMDVLMTTHSLAGAHVHLPADKIDSAFTCYFNERFEKLRLKRLTALSYSSTQMNMFQNGAREPAMLFDRTAEVISHDPVKGDGSWRSELGLKLIAQADFVTTNPPFSHVRKFLQHLILLNNDFSIIAPITATHYVNIFYYLKRREVSWHIAYDDGRNVEFVYPDGSLKRVTPIGWASNLPNPYPAKKLDLKVKWTDDIAHKYPRFNAPHNFARNVNRLSEIPLGYYDWLGVPETYELFDDDRFERVGFCRPAMNGKEKYVRMLIKQVRD